MRRDPCTRGGLAGLTKRAHADRSAQLARREKPMPRIKHIALTTKDPGKTAAFYKEAFGLQEVRRSPNGAVFLTDGYINLAILNWKTDEKDADVGPNGSNYSGIHNIGFEVDGLEEACAQLEKAQGMRITQKA